MHMEGQLGLSFWSATPPARDVPGLRYCPDFLTPAEEAALTEAIDGADCWSHELKRRVQHYGYRYDYRARLIDESVRTAPFPSWLTDLSRRLRLAGLMQAEAEQAIVNEYLPGQGIANHIDCEPCFGPEIVSISLGSGCELLLSCPSTGQHVALYLDSRCALVLRGKARYEWMHGIRGRLSDLRKGERLLRRRRLSITFRTIMRRPLASD